MSATSEMLIDRQEWEAFCAGTMGPELEPCAACEGEGKIDGHRCAACDGTGTTYSESNHG